MKRILVCEDEDAIRDFVVINLERVGYEVFPAPNGEEALKIFEESGGNFDVALLDIMMPGIDGLEVCKEIRKTNSNIGIIMLSAKSQEMDKVGALMYGADDYITKPFGPAELTARVDAIYRRVSMLNEKSETIAKENQEVFTQGDFVLDLSSRTLTKQGEELDLTQVEFGIMEMFMASPNVALERGEILKGVWGEGYVGNEKIVEGNKEKIVDVNIRRLRMKIEDDPSNPKHITTVWGYGYKWQS